MKTAQQHKRAAGDVDRFGTRIVNMTVKAKDGAYVLSGGAPIPGDHFVTVPMSATLVRAVKLGDLEEAESTEQESRHQKHQHRASRGNE